MPEHVAYGHAPRTADIMRKQMDSLLTTVADLSYEPCAFETAALLALERLQNVHGSVGFEPVVDREQIACLIDTLHTDKGVGFPFNYVDKCQTKAEWLDDPVRREALIEFVYVCMRDKKIDTEHEFCIKYDCSECYFECALKGEMRSEVKIAVGATRLFFPSSLFWHALELCLFGACSSAIHSAWNVREQWIRVGISKQYGNWDLLSRQHAAREHTDEDDATGFDASQCSVGSDTANRVFCNLALPPEWVEFGQDLLLRELKSVLVDPLGNFYRKAMSGASGRFLTSDLNSVYRMI